MYYHGTSVGNLTELKPSISEHGKPYIYFSTNPVVALFYTVKAVEPPFNWFPYGFKNGIPVYTEYYPDALADIYSGRQGFIYEFEKLNNIENPTDINCACVCKNSVKTEKFTEIHDVYEKMLEYEKSGDLIIERYESLSENRLENIENIIKSEIEEYNLKQNPECSYAKFILKKFPQWW